MKIRTTVLLADLLWEKANDEAYARQLFLKSSDLIKSIKATAATDRASLKDKREDADASLTPERLRALKTLLFQKLSRHDPALAKRLSSESTTNTEEPQYIQSLGVARDLARDGQYAKAVSFAEQGLKGDLSGRQRLFEVLYILKRIRLNDEKAADRLFLNAVSQLRGLPFVDANDVLTIGTYLFTGKVAAQNQSPTVPVVVEPARVGAVYVQADVSVDQPNLSPVVARTYLESATDMLSRATPDTDANARRYAAAYLLLPKAKRYAPEFVYALSILANNLIPSPQATDRDGNAPDDRSERLTPEAVLRKIDGITDAGARTQYALQIVRAFYSMRDYDAATAVVKKIRDQAVADKLIDIINFGRASDLLKDGQVEAAEQAISRLSSGSLRGLLRLGLARIYFKRRDRVSGEAVVEAAIKEAQNISEGEKKIYLMLTAVEMLGAIDTSAAASRLRETVKVINNLEEKSQAPSQAMTETIKVGTYSMTFPLSVPGVNPISFYATLKPLAVEDPQGTTATVLELRNEMALSQSMLALASIFLR
ncbi:MAG: hypothetical protein ICV60_16235 [Pyrinomonadaceae bacterium]|nr:hypothetical protein [Pyrinomonadaceae bacterium]